MVAVPSMQISNGTKTAAKRNMTPNRIDQQSNTSLQLSDLIEYTHQENSLKHVAEMYPTLKQPWPAEACHWNWDFIDLLPELPPVLKYSVQAIPSWCHEPVKAVHIYVDRSQVCRIDIAPMEPLAHGLSLSS